MKSNHHSKEFPGFNTPTGVFTIEGEAHPIGTLMEPGLMREELVPQSPKSGEFS